MRRAMVIGMGAVGQSCARAFLGEADVELVGLVDADPTKQGKRVGELGGSSAAPVGQDFEPVVAETVDVALGRVRGEKPDVAVICMGVGLEALLPLVRTCLQQGMSVVSNCDELVWPWYRHPKLAEEMDREAQAAGRVVMGVSVNPGFVMDLLPLVLAMTLRKVAAIRIARRINAGVRRESLQARIGATLRREEFAQGVHAGRLGHRGMAESLAMLAWGCGREVRPGMIEETVEPVLAERALESARGLIAPGCVAGLRQTARWADATLAIDLQLEMVVGLADPADRIQLDGPVSLTCQVPGAFAGDSATLALLLRYIKLVATARPGLRRMMDLFPALVG